MERKEDKLFKTLKFYKEAIGERPSGELHPDLAGDQEQYEDDAYRAELTDRAGAFFNEVFEEVKDFVADRLADFYAEEAENEAALDVFLDDNSPGNSSASFEVSGFAEIMWKVASERGLRAGTEPQQFKGV